jgi:S1-C subfamily serine protease
MSRAKTYLPALAGAVALAVAIVALVIATSNSNNSTTTVISSSSGATVPNSVSSGGVSQSSINSIYKKDINGVVDIDVTSVTSGTSTTGFGGSQEEEGEGAGVVYDNKGDIVTDEHVVADATKVTVHFEDGYSAPAKVLGTDPSTDMAVIRVSVPAKQLHPIPFANSDDAQVGDQVVAIGSPFGLPGTTTSGIVSATGRSIQAPNNYTISDAIQTDAAINPGNSGGPLLDAAGDVLGLNDQIQTSSGDNSGVGFATPGNADIQVANTIIAGKKVEHPYVGVCLNDTDNGAQIASSGGSNCTGGPVVAGSPAASAGLQPGDTIKAVDGKTITSTDDFIAVVSTYKPGQTVTMTVKEPNQSGTKQIKVTLGNRPATAPTSG